MKLSCLILRPWLIPYTNGTLETDRPALATRIGHHIADCGQCRTEATRLESNDAILRGYAARSRGRQDDVLSGSRGKTMTPLSSRVLASIQSDEKLHSSNRWSPNGLSFATAALGVAVFVSVINPQSGVFAMIHNFLVPPTHVVKEGPKPQPFPPFRASKNNTPMGPSNGGGVTPVPSSGTGSDGAGMSQSEATHVMNGVPSPMIARYGTAHMAQRETGVPASVPVGPAQSSDGASSSRQADYVQTDGENQDQSTAASVSAPILPTIGADTVGYHTSVNTLNDYVTTGPSTEYNGHKGIGIDSYGATPPPAPKLGESGQLSNKRKGLIDAPVSAAKSDTALAAAVAKTAPASEPTVSK